MMGYTVKTLLLAFLYRATGGENDLVNNDEKVFFLTF